MFSQDNNDKESKTQENNNQIKQKKQTQEEPQEKQELEKKKTERKYFVITLMQSGMNGVDFEFMYNQSINSKISEIIGEVCVDGIKQ